MTGKTLLTAKARSSRVPKFDRGDFDQFPQESIEGLAARVSSLQQYRAINVSQLNYQRATERMCVRLPWHRMEKANRALTRGSPSRSNFPKWECTRLRLIFPVCKYVTSGIMHL